ncbi:MAG: proline--tRNA ligase [Nanoarchaeota archaeon]
MKKEENALGLTAEKDDFTEWFIQLMLKSELADYSSVSGCIVFRPASYAIWEKIRDETDKRFKNLGIKNAYFPLFISERTLAKEAVHVAGFSPEVAWVTQAGNTKLPEKLAVRPTSETIMYESYSKWIRSWRDLPLRLNQWNNVVRWEFKHPVPFFRTREFLWNEGHTVFATKKEAEAEKDEIIGVYKDICENYLALPALIGKKTEKEKFAGAEYTVSMEFYMPNGKCAQGPDFHHDGQIFAKAYNIAFLNKEGKKEYAYQNTFAISTRMLGVMFAIHSDQKGLIIPPNIAQNKLVIIPILFEDSKSEVLKEAELLKNNLGEFSPILDKREECTPGFKFNDWELKGVPIRIEIGPKDIKEKSVIVTRRDTSKKEKVKISNLKEYIEKELNEMQSLLFAKAKKLLDNAVKQADTKEELKKVLSNKGIALSPLCSSEECEDYIKSETLGAKALNIPDKQPSLKNKLCLHCHRQAKYYAYIGKSY